MIRLVLAFVVWILGTGTGSHGQDTEDSGTPVFAHQLLRDRRYDLAAEEYETFLKGSPSARGALEAHYGLATARLFLGQHAEARKHFEDFLALAPPDHPNVPTATFRVGETAYMLGDLPAARAALERYVRDHPEHRHLETAWPYLGDLRFRLGDLEGAVQAYRHSIETFPQGRMVDRARYGLGRTLAQRGETDAALDLFRQVIDSGSTDWADKARYQSGLVLLQVGRTEEAVASFEALEATAPNRAVMEEARLQHAEALIRLERLDEAVAILTPLTEGEGRIAPSASYALTDLLRKQGKLDQALELVEKASERFGGTTFAPLLRFRSAEILAALGRIDEAQARYREFAEAFANDAWSADALVRAGELALRAGDKAGARQLADRFLDRFPDHRLALNARLIAAQSELDSGSPQKAVTLLEQGLQHAEKADPSAVTSAKLLLGIAYRASGQAEQAKSILQNALVESGEAIPPESQYLLGLNAFEAGLFAEAIAPLEAFLESRPDGDVAMGALAMLAIAHLETGNIDAAEGMARQLAERFPNSDAVRSTSLRFGEIALDANQHGRAASRFRDALQGNRRPEVQIRANMGLGWALLGLDKPGEAADAFRQVLDNGPEGSQRAEASLALAWALDRDQKPDEALKAYDDYLGQDPDDERVWAARVARARLLERIGTAAADAEDPERAKDYSGRAASAYEELLAHPEAWTTSGAEKPTLLAEWGWALLGAGRRGEADTVFQRILDEAPDSTEASNARLILAETAYQEKKLDEVEGLLGPLLHRDDDATLHIRDRALFQVGLARFDRGDWSGAREAFGRIVDEIPNSPSRDRARFWRAEAAFQGGDAVAAERGFKSLLDDAQSGKIGADAATWLPTARLRRAEALNELKRWSEALEEADILKSTQANITAHHELDYARGRALQGLGRFEEARAAYQAVIDANRADDFAARARFMRGETFFHQERFSEALKEYLRVGYDYDAPAWEAFALFESGQVAEKMNRLQDAVGFYRKIRSDFPNDPLAEKASERMAAITPKLAPAALTAPGQ